MQKMTASRSNPDVIHFCSREHSTDLPAVLSSSVVTCCGNGKQFVGAPGRKLIMADEIALFSKKMRKPSLVLVDISIELGFPGDKVRPGRAADHSPPSNAAVMEE